MGTGLPFIFNEMKPDTNFQSLTRISLKRSDASEHYVEEFLQAMIHRCPEIIPVQDYLTGALGLISLGREISLDVGGGKIRSLDNLLITTDGRLVMVEAKLWRNPEALREVVAQALEYARVLTSMSMAELDLLLRTGIKTDAVLRERETVGDYLERLNDKLPLDGFDPTVFAGQLERNLRNGESLLLILGDGIHPSVERFVSWFQNSTSLPFHFGLVQISIFKNPETSNFCAVPRSLLTTKEVARHVVTVDVRAPEGVQAHVRIDSEIPAPRGSVKSTVDRQAITSGDTIGLEKLLASVGAVSPDAVVEVSRLCQDLQALGFTPLPTKIAIAYALVFEGEEDKPIRLLSVWEKGIYAGYVQPALGNLELDASLADAYRRGLNKIAPFWDETKLAEVSGGKSVPWSKIQGKTGELLKVVKEAKEAITRAYAQ